MTLTEDTASTRIHRSGPDRMRVGLATQSLVHGSALLRAWSRDPGIAVQAVVFPAFLLVMFQFVFGKTVTSMGGGDSIYGNVALVALMGAMYGTLATGVSLVAERDSGLLARLWTLPVPRAGFIAGRMVAELARTAVSTLVLFALALMMGFRFDQGWAAGIGAVVVPLVFAFGFAFVVIAIATVGSGKQIVQMLAMLFLLMLFFNTGFAPTGEYPGWLQPVVRYQPMSPAIDTMTALTQGGPLAEPLTVTAIWTIVFVAVGGPLAVRGYRRAVQQR